MTKQWQILKFRRQTKLRC